MNRYRVPTCSRRLIAAALALLIAVAAHADPALKVQKITDSVYALVGPFGNRSAENLGNNATFGFIVTDEGVILIDAGGSYMGATMIQAAIAEVTTQPVKIVINTGGQDHRWLGNGYFKAHGARIVSSRRAVEDHKARGRDQLMALNNLVGVQGMEGTVPVYADEVFDERLDITLGGVILELHHVGQAHTPGDLFAWLPAQSVMFSGDIVYVGRMLGVMPHSNSRAWIETFNAMAAFSPSVIVPGHGPASTLDEARADTLGYLLSLRGKISAFMEAGRGIEEVGTLDQSEFAHLVSYDELKGRNAQQVFQEMEWE